MKMQQQSENDELYEHHRIVVDPGQSPIRIDKFLMDRLERTSRNRIQNAAHAGAVRVNDQPVKPNFKIKPGHIITILLPRPPKADSGIVAEEIPLDIRYEDEDVLVLHKPAGLVVHPGVGVHSGTLVNGLVYYFQNSDLPVLPGNMANRPGLVHRIDKNTTGLMVIAKTEMAMTHLAKQFFDHTIERKYQALIWGEFDEDQGTIEGNIGRHPRLRSKMHVFPEGEEGKEAITHYKVLERLYYVSLVECQLETGRTHQIRVHMKHQGHPLFNDDRYGGDQVVKGTVFSKYKQFVFNCFKEIPRHALHAKSLGFTHPRTGERVFFESELPQDMTTVLDKWRSYLSSRKQLL
ncbi:MAG: RluA family pseudouridine synthase [Bacteroidota bacterium]